MVFHTFFRGRLWEISEGKQVIVYQRFTTELVFYVIRIFFSSKIEQAPKTGAGGDLGERANRSSVFASG